MSSSKSARYTRIPLRCCGTESGNFSHAVPTRIPTVNSRKWIHERPRVQAPPERDTGKGTTRRRGGAKQATGQREAKEAHEGSPRISSRSRSFSACSPASFPGLASHTTRTAPEGVRVVCGCFHRDLKGDVGSDHTRCTRPCALRHGTGAGRHQCPQFDVH
jgi:hypothetical protein